MVGAVVVQLIEIVAVLVTVKFAMVAVHFEEQCGGIEILVVLCKKSHISSHISSVAVR